MYTTAELLVPFVAEQAMLEYTGYDEELKGNSKNCLTLFVGNVLSRSSFMFGEWRCIFELKFYYKKSDECHLT